MPISVVKSEQQVIATTKVEKSGHPEEQSTEVVDTVVTEASRVGVMLGYTKNLANMEFLKIEVRIEVPCGCNPTAQEAAADYASKFCEDRIAKILAEAE